MVALRGRDIDAYLARPDPDRPIALLYGSDTGLIRERADALCAAAVDDPSDPFALVRLDDAELSGDGARLVDEAMTMPLFGGRRAVRVRGDPRHFARAVEVLCENPPRDCLVVIEAGALRPNASLRSVCEKAKTAVAIACFPDTARDLAQLIETEMREANLRISRDAQATLMALLGGDRQASRNEIRKLALYAHGKGEVTLDDVLATVSDASDFALDPIVDAAFAGRPADVETAFNKAIAAGTYPGLIVSAALRQAAALHRAALLVETGTAPQTALERAIPRLHFSRKDVVAAGLRNAGSVRLAEIIGQLGTAALDVRRQAALASSIARRALMAIAVNARRRG
ncbi:MAG: DNA polymerase III subunit delta [Proteobacteria bacterium]|nr:MAG: DNA polymerase III subunit delta [Pseudomonadota bacterium]